jgi:Gram-negative bacterial TonB protein C-terminal
MRFLMLAVILAVVTAAVPRSGTLCAASASGAGSSAGSLDHGNINRDSGLFRVDLDSGMVLVRLTGTATAIEVIAPTGTFMLFVRSRATGEEWVRAATEAERAVMARSGAPIEAAVIRNEIQTVTEYRLDPVIGDPQTRFLLSGGNGAWEFNLRISAEQSAAIFSALRGELSAGVLPYDYPRMRGDSTAARPHVYGAWLGQQVDRPVSWRGYAPRIIYPGELRGSGIGGIVELAFIVDANGRARQSSIRLIRTPHPLLAVAARKVLLDVRYQPAELDGKPVAQITQQQFIVSE